MAKKALTALAVAFAAYYMLKEPENAAAAVSGAGVAVGDAFESLVTFFTALFS